MLNHENLSIFQREDESTGLIHTVITAPELPNDTAFGIMCPMFGVSVGATFTADAGWRDPIATADGRQEFLDPAPLVGKSLDEGLDFMALFVDVISAGKLHDLMGDVLGEGE